jgi:DNA-binding transcriptional LysR family regulator
MPEAQPSQSYHARWTSTKVDPDRLRTFLTVSRKLSYTRAAAELHLSQPAVWRQVRSLELELGVRLLEQIGKSLHLTDAGRTLVREAEPLLAKVGLVAEAVRLHARGVRGRLRIGASTTPGYYLLPPVLARFHRTHPDVDLRYEVDNSATIEQQLIRNELDIGFFGGDVVMEELASEEIARDEIVCYVARSHPLARSRRVSPATLVTATCILREQGSSTRQMFESWLMSTGCELERTLVVKCPEAAKTFVATGFGFSFMSSFGLAPDLRARRFVTLPVSSLRLHRPITVAWHRSKHFSRPMTEFLELARSRQQAARDD